MDILTAREARHFNALKRWADSGLNADIETAISEGKQKCKSSNYFSKESAYDLRYTGTHLLGYCVTIYVDDSQEEGCCRYLIVDWK